MDTAILIALIGLAGTVVTALVGLVGVVRAGRAEKRIEQAKTAERRATAEKEAAEHRATAEQEERERMDERWNSLVKAQGEEINRLTVRNEFLTARVDKLTEQLVDRGGA